MNNFKLGKNALIFSIITLLTVLTWVGFEVYRRATKTTIPEVTQKQMMPLDTTIKNEIINQLKENLWFSEEELNSLNVFSQQSVGSESATWQER